MAKIIWTDKASGWMEKIYNYIAADKPLAADRLIEEIYQKAELLREFPEMGYRLPPYRRKNIRVLLYGHYRILYEIEQNGDINILSVLHGALDLKKHFFPTLSKK